ncbi:hypothetical protein FRC02_003499 [Tulasnella sp. 418]|nr:hypothetical protein FRC02_003499 [Tulasnella sp. 418]
MQTATKRKVKGLDTPKTTSKDQISPPATKEEVALQSFPYAQYSSLLGTQALLLIFSALFLPRSTPHLFGLDFLPEQKTSRDRPQHEFLQPLTASPELTLGWVCLGVGLVIPWWAGYMRIWARDDVYAKTDKFERASTASLDRSKALKGAWSATLIGIPVFYFALLLFGAPLNTHYIHTFLFSLVLSFLTIYTPIYALGIPSQSSEPSALAARLKYVQLLSEFRLTRPAERAIVYPILGALIGSLIGAIPLPLDWDRPWQAWPLVPTFGAIVGYVLASAASLVVNALLYLASFDKGSSQRR